MTTELTPFSASETITCGFSPDIDDAFLFFGLVEGHIDTEELLFQHTVQDIQTLDEWARNGQLACTVLSAPTLAYTSDNYAVLNHGATLADGFGPMVVARDPLLPADLLRVKIGIPGTLTSAFLALSLRLQQPFDYVALPPEKILPAVASGELEAGLVINEGLLTHLSYGLYNVVDLAHWWKTETDLPLPLSVIGVHRDLPGDTPTRVSRVVKASLAYGQEHHTHALAYAMTFVQGMDSQSADTIVSTYLNASAIEMGAPGQRSLEMFLSRSAEHGLLPAVPHPVYLQ